MQDDIRKSGLPVIGDVPWGTHFCQFYRTKQDLIDTLVPYFKTGLENHEFCMWVTADNLTAEDASKAMTKAIKGFSAYLKTGQIKILPYDEWCLKNGQFDSRVVLNSWVKKLNQALKKGYEGLRLTCNTFWLEKKDWHSFTDYEEAVNNVIGKYKMIALCTYCLEKCSAAEIVDVIRNHEFALIKQEGKWELFENSRYKAAKEDLIESEKRFRLALKNAPVTVAAQDRNLRFLWAYNQRTIRPEDVLGKTDFDLFSKPDAKKLIAMKNKVMENGKAINTKMWVTSNHKKVYLEIYLEPIQNKTGEITGVEIATVDLTGQKRMEDALKESEGSYHKLFENMSEGLAHCEMLYGKYGKPIDYRFLNSNPIFDKFIGLSREQIIGKTIRDILPNVQLKAIKTFGKVVSTGKPAHFENYSHDLKKWFDVYAYRTRPGQFAYMVIDITERKLAEEEKQKLASSIKVEKDKLSALVNSIPDEVWFADTQKNFTLANPSALREFGYNISADTGIEALAKSLEVLRSDGTPRPVDEAPPLRALRGETINHQEEMVRTPLSGELRYRQVSAAPVKDTNGNVIGAVSVVRDITAQKEAENALKESEERFRAISEASPVIISVTRVSDGVVLYVNKSYSESLGYKQEDLIGKTALNVYYDPAERKAMIDKLNKQGFLQNYEVRVKKADGTPFWASTSVRFINYGGERTIMAASLDISERKQAEAELAHLASFPELNPNPIVELEESGKISYLNLASKDAFPDLLTCGLKHPFLTEWENLMKTIKHQDNQSITREINVGQHWYLQTVIYVSKTDHYHIYGRDITERKKVEYALLKNEKRFQLLSEINGLLLTSEQTEQIIQIVADKVMVYLNCDAFFNFIVDESQGRLRLNAYTGIPPEAAAEIEWLDFGSAICGCVARDNQPIVSVNVQENGDERAALVRSYGIKAYASYPLHIGQKITGTVSFGTRTHTSFTYDELRIIETVADQISVAMRRKQAETELKASEERFSKAFHSSPVALSISRISDGTFIDVNQSFLHLFGYTREELVGQKAIEINIYDNPDNRSEIVRMLQQQGKIVNYEVIARTKTGNEIKVLTSAEKIDINGQVHIIWTTIDISEREQAEEMLRETTNYLNNLLDYANAPIIVWDTHFRISRFNPAFERLTGYHSPEVIGLGLDILFPEDKKEESLRQIRRTLSGERWEVVEIPILRVDGELRTVLWNSANVYDDNGKNIIATIAQGQDITERKLAEQQLQETSDYLNNLLNYANAPIIVWDSNFRITRFNHAFERLTGISADEAVGQQLDILFPEDSKAESMRYINRTMSGERWEVVEIPILRKDGTIRIVLWNSATLMNTEGKKMVATIAQGQDITERKQAEEAINKLNEELKQHSIELEATNKELEAFAYSVSHDLRAPLRSMEGFSQALLEDCQDILNDECKDYLKRIQSSAELMAQLIDDLLQLSRFTRVDMVLNDVNLSEMAQSIATDLKKFQPKRKIELVITPGLIARGDEKLLRIALHNLLENAWKFTGKVPEAHIEFGITEQEGKKTFFVRDNGAGFDMTYISKIFNPFQRLHSVDEFPGTGIGLASVQRIIHRHGGQVWAEGKVGEGATFYFTLG